MKNLNLRFLAVTAFFTLLAAKTIAQTTTVSFTNPANNGLPANTFTVPAGVTSITVEAWGGGGGGGNSNNSGAGNGGGGGGGGGYSRKVYTGLVPATVYTVNVGAGGAGGPANSTTNAGNGFVSYFNTNTAADVAANGGSRGINAGNGGAGATAGFGDVGFTFTGAAGTNSAGNGGGGGGSSAGTSANGAVGLTATAGGIAPAGGGNGGAGSTTANGTAGSTPGGGGGGSDDVAARTGGAGANGQVTVTYTLPNVTGLTAALASPTCKGGTVTFNISSSNLVTDTYTVTYNITGTGNNVSSTTASMNFTAGAPGTGTFSTVAILSVAETDVLNITRVTNSTGNFVDFTSNTNFAVSPCNSWYSYQTGNFSDFNTWTLDPSGTTFDNGLNTIPTTSDEISILNGFTVTYDVNNLTLASTAIQGGGTLDMAATTGHTLGIVTGTGLLRVGGISFPTGTYTDFVSTLGGTIEYYNIGGNLPITQTTYNKLIMSNSTGSNITYVLVSNLTVNGTFNLTTTGVGTVTWQINDASNTQRTIVLNNDLTVSAGGRITVGTGNEASTTQHDLTMYGNFTNNGIVKFYDPLEESDELPVANYGLTTAPSNNIYTNERQGNAVGVTFSGATDRTVTCNNTTDFYRFILNKGTGQQAVLTVNSANTSYFRLFGPTNRGSSGGAPNITSLNSLSLVNGTLELTGSINIPNLIVNFPCVLCGRSEFFSIPQNAALWLNSAGVTITSADNTTSNDDQRVLVDGLLKVTTGTLNTGYSKGIGSGSAGSMIIEGGTVNCWQFRPYALGTGIFAFNQSGGTFNVGYGFAQDGGEVDGFTDDYARFDLASTSSSFQMSGGTLNVAKASDLGGFIVGSASGNYSVTGGTVNFYGGLEAADDDIFIINTTAPLYNVNIFRESGTAIIQLATNSLTVLNNLSIGTGNTPTFSCNNLNLTVGGNFDIQSATTFTPGSGVVTFNGTGSHTWTHNGTISALATAIINKPAGTLTLAGSQTIPDITTALTLTSGTLADGGKTVTVTGTLTNNATHSGAGSIVYNNAGASTINGNNGTFGNLTIQTNATIATSGGQTVTGTLRLVGASTTLNIGTNALTVSGNIYANASPGTAGLVSDFSATKRIQTNGLHNAGGLTRQGAAGDLVFPVGTGTLYTPNVINVALTSGSHGLITVRPVASEHPNVTTTSKSLQYYWRVSSAGAYTSAVISTVTHKTYTFSTATKAGTAPEITLYRSARFDPTALTWATNNTTFNATASTVIPNFNANTTAWTGLTGGALDKLDGEYTCGNVAAFGNVTTYYSKASGNWNATTTWSNDPVLKHTGANASVAPPCATCPVVIGDGASINHTITTVANSTCGSLALNTGSILDCSTFTGHNFGTSTGGIVSGRGRLRINSNVFPPGDFTNFIGASGGTVEWYGSTKTIPTIGGTPQFLNLPNYYNLVVNPSTGQTITLPGTNLTVFNDLTLGDAAGFDGTVVTNGARTIAITGNLTVTRGTFNFSNVAASATTMTVTGNLSVANSSAFSVAAAGTANANTLSITGNITNNGTMNFNNTGTVALTFTGASNSSFTGTGSGGTTLSTITVNKGSSQTPTLTFNVSGTVNTTPIALGWLTLANGTFDWASTQTTSLSTTSYTIAPTTKLRISSGTLNTTSGDTDTDDLFLNGALEVSGGTVNVGNTTVNANNVDLEYSSAGVPVITVASGSTLWVKGSIRRSSSTITGALAYTQTGGSVTVGGISSTDVNSRGVFEIDANTGSNFTLTGTSSLIVQRQTGGTGYADVFINPITSNVSSTSTISLGLSTVATNTNFRINIAPTIGNLTVAGTNAHTVNMFSNPLVMAGTLTIPSLSTLNTNSLNVTIGGDLVCAGTYTGGTNNTTFNGTGAQSGQLSSTSTFNDFTVSKTAGTTLTLSGTSPTLQNLYLLSGILDVGSLALDIRRNVTNNSTQIGSGSILIFSTTPLSNTITSTNGSFTNLTLGGTATTKSITVTGNTTINGTLSFPASGTRYLNIGSSQLTFSTTATAVANASSTRYIRTNGVSSDLGVVRNWPVGASQTFVYQVGSSTFYTPVSYSLTVTVPGTLTVIPVNSAHPTYNQSSAEEILNYYWSVARGGTLAATASGSHTYTYPSSLLTCTSCTGSPLAGYLDGNSNPLGWTTSGHGGTATTTLMTFTSAPSTNLPIAGNFYDYSVGTANTLPNPILPLYSRISPSNSATVGNTSVGGSWTTASNWTTDADGDLDGNNASSLVPTGVPVVILANSRINTQSNGRRAFKTTINGLLNNGTRTGHNFGIIAGTGTFRTATNTFPAGNYTAFVAAGGGTIEYVAPMTMNSRTTYNNLSIFSGSSGTLTMTNSDLVLNGNLTIPTGTTLSNASNRDISIAGNWSNSGAFTQGTGEVIFTGTTAQTISGANAFYDLTMSKSTENVTLSGTGSTTVSNSLTLTTGNIISSATNTLALGTATLTGGSASSYIAGPVTKTIGASASFVAPLGSITPVRYRPATIGNTSGSDCWSFEYFASNPTTGGFNNQTLNSANLGSISQYEYWIIDPCGSTSADLTLTYGVGSYLPPDIGTEANLRVGHWDGSQWDLPSVGGGSTNGQSSGNNVAGTITVTNMTSFSPVTNTSTDDFSPLPIGLLNFSAKLVDGGVELRWKTATEIDNDFFTIEKSSGGEKFTSIGTIKGQGTSYKEHQYSFLDDNLVDGKAYYRLKQTDFNGVFTYSKVILIEYHSNAVVNLLFYPNPVEQDDQITLEVSGLKEVVALPLTISDQLGRQHRAGQLEVDNAGFASSVISLEGMPNGVYLLQIGNTNKIIKRLIIAR